MTIVSLNLRLFQTVINFNNDENKATHVRTQQHMSTHKSLLTADHRRPLHPETKCPNAKIPPNAKNLTRTC